MQYSEYPHSHYINNGKGPGANYLGDMEMWNWRWLLIGDAPNTGFDEGVAMFFNDEQREMMQAPPMVAANALASILDADRITDQFWDRASAAEARLRAPRISSVKDNIIHANFRR